MINAAIVGLGWWGQASPIHPVVGGLRCYASTFLALTFKMDHSIGADHSHSTTGRRS